MDESKLQPKVGLYMLFFLFGVLKRVATSLLYNIPLIALHLLSGPCFLHISVWGHVF